MLSLASRNVIIFYMESENFDISALSYEEFVEYFFTTPSGEFFELDANGHEYWLAEISDPAVVLSNLTTLCTDFRKTAEGLSQETLANGIDGILSPAHFQVHSVLWNNSLPLKDRIACIRSMYRVFADYVANSKVQVMEGSFYMWWDYVCTAFWFEQTYERKLPVEKYDLLDEDDRRLVDAMFETLIEILALDDERSKSSALHGLGHLHHPGVPAVVQKFIDARSTDLDPLAIKWLESCRDGKAM